MPPDPPYDPDAALELLDLRAQGIQPDDILAWVYPSRDAAEAYARANARLWDHPSLGIAIDANGQVIGVTDLRDQARPSASGSPADTPAAGGEHGESAVQA
jgi:hypothetical protein